MRYGSTSQKFLFADLLWLRKITKDSYIHAHVYECLVFKIRYLYRRTDFRQQGILIRNNMLQDLMLNKLTVARFVSTVGFLLRYLNGHTK